jgi:plastocyanin
MHSLRLTSFALPAATMAAILMLGLLACGDGDDETTATNTETATEAESTAPESGAATGDGETGGNASAPSGDAVRSEKVQIIDFAYDPDPVTIEEGGKVIWINRDAAPHTATADDDSFDTGRLNAGNLKSESFKEPGEYAYFCEIHPEMRGTVEVVPSG